MTSINITTHGRSPTRRREDQLRSRAGVAHDHHHNYSIEIIRFRISQPVYESQKEEIVRAHCAEESMLWKSRVTLSRDLAFKLLSQPIQQRAVGIFRLTLTLDQLVALIVSKCSSTALHWQK